MTISAPPDSPAGVTGFIGRDDELAELEGLLERERLVTLTGAPGIGKSRLALEVARHRDHAGKGAAGTQIVDLSAVSDPSLVPGAVAAALSVREVGGQSLTRALVARLRRRRLLLVLDNCEHLLDACVQLFGALREGCPHVVILATSREALGMPGEHVHLVPGLSVPALCEPPDPDLLTGYAAVRLFVARARAAQPGFSLNPYVAPDVAEITRRVDGIPLAIELAAARVDILTPGEIAKRLDHRIDLLTNGRVGDASRHHTLQAALDWSHDLLSLAEQGLLRRLPVFVGGFDFPAVAAVCSGGDVPADDVHELLRRLVAKSLVMENVSPERGSRYRLLDTIRTYGANRLERAGEQAEVRKAHAEWYLDLAEKAEPELTSPHQERWLQILDADHGNLRGAAEWSLGQGDGDWALRIGGALILFWRVRGYFSEGRALLQAALSVPDDEEPTAQPKALWGLGFMTLMLQDAEGAVALLKESLSRFRAVDDRTGCARALLILGDAQLHAGDPSALALIEQSAIQARETGDTWCLAHALGRAGTEHAARNEHAAARPLLEECIAVARECGDKQSLRLGLLGLGSLVGSLGDYPLAATLLEEALAVIDDLGEDYFRVSALAELGQLAFARGEYARAGHRLDEALALSREGRGPAADSILLFMVRSRVARAENELHHARRLLKEARALVYDNRSAMLLFQARGEQAIAERTRPVARPLFEEALALAHACGDTYAAAQALYCLGDLAQASEDLKRARALHNEALGLQRQIGNTIGMASSIEALAGLAAEARDHRRAACLLGAAEAHRERVGHVREPQAAAAHDRLVALVRSQLSSAGFEAVFSKGKQLSIERAAAAASSDEGRRTGRPSSGWSSLTERERQVATLAGEGLTNPEIAARLVVSLATVKGHLTEVFSKLGVARRTALVRDVASHGHPPVGSAR